MDVQSVIEGWPAEFVDNFGFETSADSIGVETDDIEGMMFIEPEDLELESTVMLGSFDPDHVVQTMAPDEPAEAYDGFQVIGGFIAVDEEALIISNQYESYIEAGVAGGDRIIDQREHWERGARAIETPELATIEHNPDDAQDLLAMAIYRIEDGFDITGYAFFADADTAEAEIDDLEAAIEEELDTGEITDIYRIENVIVAEARAGEDFLRI